MMITRPVGRAIAVMALAQASFVHAVDTDWSGSLKVRSGFQVASRKDHLSPQMLGFGVEASGPLASGRIGVELGFFYKPGTQHLIDPQFMAVVSGKTVAPKASADSRKNQVEGLNLRLSYELPRSWGAYRAGLQVGSLKFRQEYVATVGDGSTYEDTYNGVVDKGSLSVSPYIGVSFPVLEHHALEVNLLALNYKAAHYIHVAGTVSDKNGGHTAMDSIQTTSRFVPHVEVGFAFRF